MLYFNLKMSVRMKTKFSINLNLRCQQQFILYSSYKYKLLILVCMVLQSQTSFKLFSPFHHKNLLVLPLSALDLSLQGKRPGLALFSSSCAKTLWLLFLLSYCLVWLQTIKRKFNILGFVSATSRPMVGRTFVLTLATGITFGFMFAYIILSTSSYHIGDMVMFPER